MEKEENKELYHVYICMAPTATVSNEDLINIAGSLIKSPCTKKAHSQSDTLHRLVPTDHATSTQISYIEICDSEGNSSTSEIEDQATIEYHCFQLHADGPIEEMDEGENIMACQQWELPSKDFDGLWESLIYEENIKSDLLNYVATAMVFSDQNVNGNIISCNRVILLHGPPGTGKTSLCKAIAQRTSMHLNDRYSTAMLVEINAHSLFSKWFSESGKLVQKMFEKIKTMVENQDCLVFVLIDEVESLTSARTSAMSGSDPSDAIRVVNALLTQIDQLKSYPNVIILTTSNITAAIDLAFIDRADIKQYIGYPSLQARYEILKTCIEELQRVNIIEKHGSNYLTFKEISIMQEYENFHTKPSLQLFSLAKKCEGLSGRNLRKLPFLAHALHLKGKKFAVNKEDFLVALSAAINREFNDRKHVNK